MSKCNGCGKFLAGGAPNTCSCTNCNLIYHKACLNLPATSRIPTNWVCPCCISSAPRTDNTNTPVKQQVVEEPCSGDIAEKEPSTKDDSERLLLQELRGLRRDMNEFRKDFGSFKNEVRGDIKDLRGICQSFDNKMEHFTERLDKQESRLVAAETTVENARQEVIVLAQQVQTLKEELAFKEQRSLQNDLEISGVTEHKGENVTHLVGLIMNKIGVQVDERDVVEVHRVGPVILDDAGAQRPRPIVMRVVRRSVREEVLRGARARRGITTADVDVAGNPRKIFINERLTKENRVLFGHVRRLCNQHNWKFSWTREGKIYAREIAGKPAFRIHREEDCNKIFKQPSN